MLVTVPDCYLYTFTRMLSPCALGQAWCKIILPQCPGAQCPPQYAVGAETKARITIASCQHSRCQSMPTLIERSLVHVKKQGALCSDQLLGLFWFRGRGSARRFCGSAAEATRDASHTTLSSGCTAHCSAHLCSFQHQLKAAFVQHCEALHHLYC